MKLVLSRRISRAGAVSPERISVRPARRNDWAEPRHPPRAALRRRMRPAASFAPRRIGQIAGDDRSLSVRRRRRTSSAVLARPVGRGEHREIDDGRRHAASPPVRASSRPWKRAARRSPMPATGRVMSARASRLDRLPKLRRKGGNHATLPQAPVFDGATDGAATWNPPYSQSVTSLPSARMRSRRSMMKSWKCVSLNLPLAT